MADLSNTNKGGRAVRGRSGGASMADRNGNGNDHLSPLPDLEAAQRAEGAQPPKPVRWGSLPKWLRLFGRIWLTIVALLVLVGLVSAWLR